MHGKILLFKPTNGNGIIISSSREKVMFSIEDWDDFDLMPALGLEVVFNHIQNKACNIVSKEHEETLRSDNKEEEKVEEDIKEKEIVPQVEEDIKETEREEKVEKEPENTENDSENTEKDTEEPFAEDPIIQVIGDVSKELESERPESITNSLTITTAVANYFLIIKQNIEQRKNYKKASGRLDYRLIRRFIWTTFNNLKDIDMSIVTPKIKIISQDLKGMEAIYDDFIRKTKNPALAYEEVFLACQAEYQKIQEGAENLIEKIRMLQTNEKIVGGEKEIKKKELEEQIDSEQFMLMKNELKSLNGSYVDIVHMMAELDERYKQDMKLLKDFEAEYREDFYKIFSKKAKEYAYDLVDILNAQAFIFDMQQWHQAKRSKTVKEYFQKSSIYGELNTKTYLKYYLDSQDKEKATDETKTLFELYDYLVSVQKDYIMVVSADYRDAIDYETAIQHADKNFDVKSFVDELLAIKWAMRNSVKVLVLEDNLASMQVEKFLFNYNKNVTSIPKIILLGNKPRSNTMPISKLLNSGVSPSLVATNVNSLLK